MRFVLVAGGTGTVAGVACAVLVAGGLVAGVGEAYLAAIFVFLVWGSWF